MGPSYFFSTDGNVSVFRLTICAGLSYFFNSLYILFYTKHVGLLVWLMKEKKHQNLKKNIKEIWKKKKKKQAQAQASRNPVIQITALPFP